MAKRKTPVLKQTTLAGFTAGEQSSQPRTRKRVARSKPKPTQFESASERESDSSAVGAIHFENKPTTAPIEVTEDEDPVASPNLRSKRKVVVIDSDSSDEEPPPVVKSKKRPVSIDTDDEQLEEQPQPRKRKLVKGFRPSHTEQVSSDDDLDADKILDTRLRTRGLTTFQKNLEKMKRKKLGKAPVLSSQSEGDEDDEDDDEEVQEISSTFRGAKPTRLYGDGGSDLASDDEGDEDGFIVSDDEAPVELPTEFSMNTYQDLVHHFKVIFQFFVHIAAKPSKERHEFMQSMMNKDKYFSVPLQIARRQIVGLRDSMVTSSVWRPDFKRPLETLPTLEITPLITALTSCGACHLSGRISTLLGRLSGQPYDRMGFEPIQSVIDLDQEDEDEDITDDEKNTAEFALGRFCAKRTRVFHEFSHWEHALFHSILFELDELRSRSKSGFVRVAHAGGIRPPKDLTDADGLCEWLDQRQIIEQEWHKLQSMMESARHLDMAAKRGENDD